MKAIKRILSWVVLSIGFDISFFIGWGLTLLTIWAFKEIAALSLLIRLFLYIVAGISLICIAIAPFIYGTSIVVALSEIVCESENGTRYSVLSAAYTIFAVIYAIRSINIQQSFPVWSVYLVIFCLCLKPISKIYRRKVQDAKNERVSMFVQQCLQDDTSPDEDE